VDPEVRAVVKLQTLKKIQTNVRWEPPVDERLADLLQLVRDVGGRASRAELLAALVVAAPADGKALHELILGYRTADVSSVSLSGQDVIDLGSRRPGPVRLAESSAD
jgi:hypothetical protein